MWGHFTAPQRRLAPILAFWLLLTLFPTLADESGQWEDIIQGVRLHNEYMHVRAKEMIVESARRLSSTHDLHTIVEALIAEAKHLEQGSTIGKGMLESAMEVAHILQNLQVIHQVSDSFLTLGFPHEALEGYKHVLNGAPDLVSAYHQMGVCHSRQNRLEEALEAYALAIELRPSFAITYNNIGVLLSKMGHVEEAYAHFKAAVKIDDGYSDAKQNMLTAQAELSRSEKSGAIKTLGGLWDRAWKGTLADDADGEGDANVALRMVLIEAEARRKKSLPGVMDLMLRNILVDSLQNALNATNPHALFAFGSLLMDLQAFEAAGQVYARTQELLPQSPLPHHQHAISLVHIANFSGALWHYSAAIKLDPSFALSYNNQGVLLAKLGHINEAVNSYQTAMRLDPTVKDAEHNLVQLHRSQEDWSLIVDLHSAAASALAAPQCATVKGDGDSRPSQRGDGRVVECVPPIVLATYLQHGDALAAHAANMRTHMRTRGLAVDLYDVREQALPERQPTLKHGSFTIVTVEPYRLEPPRHPTEYRIYLIVFESSLLPASWVDLVNGNANEVWTTCMWLKGVLLDSGINVPVSVMPIGTKVPALSPAWHLVENNTSNTFTFLSLANMQPRKALVKLAEAFLAAFGRSNTAVRLHVHSKWSDAGERRSMWSLQAESSIKVTEGTLSDSEMQELWREADCVVAISQGEGWGQVPREALGLGIPVVVSDLPVWADLGDDDDNGNLLYRVHSAGWEKARYAFTAEDTGDVVRIDWGHASEVMKQVVEDHRGRQRQAGGGRLHGSVTWAQAVNTMVGHLQKQVLVVSTSLGSQCGIAFYTQDLYSGAPHVAFARSWSDAFVLTKLLRPKVVHVQHEFGLHFDDEEFLHTLFRLCKEHHDTTFFVTLHTVHTSLSSRFQFYHKIARLAHVIVLNSEAPKHFNFPSHYIEHGIPTILYLHHRVSPSFARRSQGSSGCADVCAGGKGRLVRQRHIASFGFWDPEKRHDELCELAERADVAIDLYSDPPKTYGHSSCRGLVTYIRGRLKSRVLIERLSEYTALVFLRKPKHEWIAASGSVRVALNAQVPIVCEVSAHFQDLAEAVDLREWQDVAPRIKQLVDNSTLREELVQRQNRFASRWTMEASMQEHQRLYDTLAPKKEALLLENEMNKDGADKSSTQRGTSKGADSRQSQHDLLKPPKQADAY